MTVYFDYSTTVSNAYLTIADAETDKYTSEYQTNPNEAVVYQAVVDPGHGGTVTLMDWHLSFRLTTDAGSSETVAWEIEYKASGGSWVSLGTGNVTTASFGYVRSTGVVEVSLALPIQIRIHLTDADANWQITIPDSASTVAYADYCIKLTGTVS